MATHARVQKTGPEIQAEVIRLIHEGEAVREDGAQIGVPLPTPLASGVRDQQGGNWSMEVFGNATGYEAWVLHCVKSVQSRWDLKG